MSAEGDRTGHAGPSIVGGREVSQWEWEQEQRKAAERFQKSACPARAAEWVKAWRRGEIESAHAEWTSHCERVKSALCGMGATFALVSKRRGTGKTTLATEAARHVCRQRAGAVYLRAGFLLSRIRASFHRDARENEYGIIRELLRPRLLILDEMGERKESEWAGQVLNNLICARHDDGRDSILIANQDAATLTVAVGESIADRMREAGGVIEFPWASFRARNPKA